MADYYTIPVYREEGWYGDQFAGDECILEEVMSCKKLVNKSVEDVEFCVSYIYTDVCIDSTDNIIACYAVAKYGGGIEVEGECEPLMAEFGIVLGETENNAPAETPAAAPRKSSGRRGN